jgi:hypothetical protein
VDFEKNKVVLYLAGVAVFVVLIVLVLSVDTGTKPDEPKNSIISEVVSPTTEETSSIETSEIIDTSSIEVSIETSNIEISPSIEVSTKTTIIEESGYILPYSNKKELTRAELENLTIEKLNLAKNEIFARHGYIFKKPQYTDYFSKQSWYKENPNYSDKDLTAIEKKNVQIIVNYLKESGN